MTAGLLALTVFVATAVEMVEALTIVLAVGVSRGWRQALQGAIAAIAILVLLVAVFGVSLATKVPLHLLQLVVGLGLLLFGLSWLRKAVARAAGRRPYRDEGAAFARLASGLVGGLGSERRLDPVAFVAVFKGVFLEGLEAAIIAITFGAAAQRLWVAFSSAGVAVVSVALLGVIVHRPLTRVPENAMKLGVGLLLSSFGTFWVVEGLGGEWPGSEFAVLYILAAYALATFLTVRLLVRSTEGAISSFTREDSPGSATDVRTVQRGGADSVASREPVDTGKPRFFEHERQKDE
jgi:Ca2+/H+ antiporter, TMEM165/GDT1 family